MVRGHHAFVIRAAIAGLVAWTCSAASKAASTPDLDAGFTGRYTTVKE